MNWLPVRTRRKGRRAPEIDTTYSILSVPGLSLSKDQKGFVLARWKRSLRTGNDYFRKVEPTAYYRNYGRYLDDLVHKCVVRLAVLTDDHDVLLGFSTHRGHILDYVFVQTHMRRLGIATRLLPEKITQFSHLTNSGSHVWKKHQEWVFNPFE